MAGRALLDHALALADAAPVGPRWPTCTIAQTRSRAHLNTRPDIALSEETPDILETGGGLRLALPLLGDGPVMTLNTDAVWTGPNPLAALARAWDPSRMDALLLLVPPGRAIGHSGRGDFTMATDGRLTRAPGLVYSGAQILRTGDLAAIPDAAFSLNRIWDLMQARGRLYGLLHPGGWCDVGRPDCIPLAEAMLRRCLIAPITRASSPCRPARISRACWSRA